MLVGPHKGFTLLINGYDIFYICYGNYKSNISMKGLCYVYMTAILSTFLIKNMRVTECCTKYLCYIYATTILSRILITTATLLSHITYKVFTLHIYNHNTFYDRYNSDTFYNPYRTF